MLDSTVVFRRALGCEWGVITKPTNRGTICLSEVFHADAMLPTLLLHVAATAAADDCGRTVAESRARAVELYAQGEEAGADACLGAALSQATAQLEALAAEAEAIRAYRAARRQHPGTTSSCVLDAHGASLCLDGAASQLSGGVPRAAAIEECSGEAQACSLGISLGPAQSVCLVFGLF